MTITSNIIIRQKKLNVFAPYPSTRHEQGQQSNAAKAPTKSYPFDSRNYTLRCVNSQKLDVAAA